jgi:Tfp pilus assembly protein PilF
MKEFDMKSQRINAATLAALVAVSIATALSPVQAGILWVDNENESIAVPLESPTLGVARAKYYIEQGQADRAQMALKKVVAKFPTATEAHRLLAGIYRNAGKTELALTHDTLARASM